jgi:hypothetical protein
VAALAFSGQASATPTAETFSLDTYLGGGSPAPGPYGTVSLTQSSGNVMVDVLLQPPTQGFVNSGAGDALLFDLFDGTSTISPITVTGLTTGFSFTSFSAGSIHADGSGTWDYDVTCAGGACGSGGSSPAPGPLSFTIDNVTIADFIQNANGNFFASDLCIGISRSGGCGVTGDVSATADAPVPVPEPATIALVGAGLFGVWAFGRRPLRKRLLRSGKGALRIGASV